VTTISLEEAQTRLPELVAGLGPGEEVILTRDDEPVARLVGEAAKGPPRLPGNCQGLITIRSDDDAHLADFKDYMP
jgi:antitoxin (DNA-binding transcriptional repressor) of toxin-antitoxin stability system